MVRARDASNYYLYQFIKTNTGYDFKPQLFATGISGSKDLTDEISDQSGTLDLTDSQNFTIRAKGNAITIEVGDWKATVTDDTFTTGAGIGFRVDRGSNFTVDKLNLSAGGKTLFADEFAASSKFDTADGRIKSNAQGKYGALKVVANAGTGAETSPIVGGTQTVTGDASKPLTVTELLNNASYNLALTETNGTDVSEVATAEVAPSDANAVSDKPTNVEAKFDGSNANVSWTAPQFQGSALVASYNVSYAVDGSNTYSNPINVTDGTSTTLTGLDSTKNYKVRVIAVNANGNSEAAEVALQASGSIDGNTTPEVTNPKDNNGKTNNSGVTTPDTGSRSMIAALVAAIAGIVAPAVLGIIYAIKSRKNKSINIR